MVASGLEPGRHTMSTSQGDVVRRTVVYLPAAARTGARLPLVLDLHGSGSGPVEQLGISGMEAAAERYGFVVAAPQGSVPTGAGHAWNVPHTAADLAGPDEEGFLLTVIDSLVVGGWADGERVAATGMSGGARMACQLAGDHADRITAVAAVAGLRAGAPRAGDTTTPDSSTWHPARPVPVLAVHGTADPVNPLDGGGAAYWGYSVPAALARWAEANGGRGEPTTTRVADGVRLLAHSPALAQTRLYVVDGGGHTWPGSRAAFPAGLGPVSTALDATETVCRFLADHLH